MCLVATPQGWLSAAGLTAGYPGIFGSSFLGSLGAGASSVLCG